MRKKRTKFVVRCNHFIGEVVPAHNFNDLLEARMTKKQREFWSSVAFKDDDGNTIIIERECIAAGWTLEECIHDWMSFGQMDEDIIALNPRGSGTIHL